MSSATLMAKRTPAQQAQALLMRLASLERAQDEIIGRLSECRRQYEQRYWERTLRELMRIKALSQVDGATA